MTMNRNVCSLLLIVMLATVVKAMFFTDSKQNDYPRIGKRLCSTSSTFYNRLFCNNLKTDERPSVPNGVIDREDLLTPYSSIYGHFNPDIGGQDSFEDVFTPTEVGPSYHQQREINRRVMDRLQQFLHRARAEYDDA